MSVSGPCTYKCKEEDFTMAIDDLKQLTNLVDSAVEHTNLDELAHEIRAFYANVIRPQGNNLPDWPLDQVIEHLKYHIWK